MTSKIIRNFSSIKFVCLKKLTNKKKCVHLTIKTFKSKTAGI